MFVLSNTSEGKANNIVTQFKYELRQAVLHDCRLGMTLPAYHHSPYVLPMSCITFRSGKTGQDSMLIYMRRVRACLSTYGGLEHGDLHAEG